MNSRAKGTLFFGSMLFLLAMGFAAASKNALNAGSVGIALDMAIITGALLATALRCGFDVFLITSERPVTRED